MSAFKRVVWIAAGVVLLFAWSVPAATTQVTGTNTVSQADLARLQALQQLLQQNARLTDYQRGTDSRQSLIGNASGRSSSSRSGRSSSSRSSSSRSSRSSRNDDNNDDEKNEYSQMSFAERREKRAEDREKRAEDRAATRDERREAFSRGLEEFRATSDDKKKDDKTASGGGSKPAAKPAAKQPAAQNSGGGGGFNAPAIPPDPARGLLIIANIHLLNDRPEQAGHYYQLLLDTYPDSEYCLEARNQLTKLTSVN